MFGIAEFSHAMYKGRDDQKFEGLPTAKEGRKKENAIFSIVLKKHLSLLAVLILLNQIARNKIQVGDFQLLKAWDYCIQINYYCSWFF